MYLRTAAGSSAVDGVDPSCQVIVSPASSGDRLVPVPNDADLGTRVDDAVTVGTGGEIRLTYAQLTTLIDETVGQVVKSIGKA